MPPWIGNPCRCTPALNPACPHAFARPAHDFFPQVAAMSTHPLLPKLRQLKLSGMLQTLDLRAAQATERQLSPVEFLALLLDDELERRSPAAPGLQPGAFRL